MQTKRRKFEIYLILLLCLSEVHSWRNFKLEFTKVQYDLIERDMFEEFSIELRSVKNHKTIYSQHTPSVDITSMFFHFIVMIRRPKAQDFLLANNTLDGCDLIMGKFDMNMNLVRIWMELLRKSSKNFPEKCPIIKHKSVKFENIYMDAEKFPTYMPEFNYTFTLNAYFNGQYAVKVIIEGLVMPKNKRKGRLAF